MFNKDSKFQIIRLISLHSTLRLDFDSLPFLLCNEHMNASAIQGHIGIACGKLYIRIFYHRDVFEDACPDHLYIYMNYRRNRNETL